MITIHIMDGDASVRIAARRILERAGFVVTEAKDDKFATTSRPDLIIADLATINFAAIRRHYPGTPTLAINADGFVPVEAHLLAGSLKKPFTASQLLGAVRRCLARPDSSLAGATTGPRRRSRRPRPRRI
jgi:DNA-binding NtrC family response regulator